MLSPHARVREWALFTMSLDADRQRRAAGLPDRVREHLEGSRPMGGQTLLRQMQARLRPVVQASIYSGG